MPGGKLTGEYFFHTEFRGGVETPVPQGRDAVWTTQIWVPKGLWFLEITTYFQLRNVSFLMQVQADGASYGGGGLHNPSVASLLETVTIPHLVDDVPITSTGPQTIRVSMRGGRGGGGFASTGIAVVARRKAVARARKVTAAASSPAKRASSPRKRAT